VGPERDRKEREMTERSTRKEQELNRKERERAKGEVTEKEIRS
jgi:hypothetical protein